MSDLWWLPKYVFVAQPDLVWEAGFVWVSVSPTAVVSIGPADVYALQASICVPCLSSKLAPAPCAPHSSQLPLPRRSLTPISHRQGAKGPERAQTPQVPQPFGRVGASEAGVPHYWGSEGNSRPTSGLVYRYGMNTCWYT